MSNFRIDQRVVCVCESFDSKHADKKAKPPVKGEIYTINFIDSRYSDGPYLGFEEIDQSIIYRHDGFRSLSDTFAEQVTRNIAE